MGKSFGAGAAVGVAAGVAIGWIAAGSLGGGSADPVGGRHPLSAAEARPAGASPSLRTLEQEILGLREERSRLREDLSRAEARAGASEEMLRELGKRHDDLRKETGEASAELRRKTEGREKAMKVRGLRQLTRMGAPLGDKAAEHIGLEGDQRRAVDEAMSAEQAALDKALRDLLAETGMSIPEGADPDTLCGMVIWKSGDDEIAKVRALFSDPDIAEGRKEAYLEEVLGERSLFVRLLDELVRVRDGTIETASQGLTAEQRERLDEVLKGNFLLGKCNLEWIDSNVKLHKPR